MSGLTNELFWSGMCLAGVGIAMLLPHYFEGVVRRQIMVGKMYAAFGMAAEAVVENDEIPKPVRQFINMIGAELGNSQYVYRVLWYIAMRRHLKQPNTPPEGFRQLDKLINELPAEQRELVVCATESAWLAAVGNAGVVGELLMWLVVKNEKRRWQKDVALKLWGARYNARNGERHKQVA